MKYSELREAIEKALPKNSLVVDFDESKVVYTTYEDRGPSEKYFEAEYSIGEDGTAALGQPVEVERKVEYVKAQAAIRLSGAENKGVADYGYRWRVRVLEFGTDVNGTHWTKGPLLAALGMFDGARVFMLSEAQHQENLHPFGKPPGEIVGWLSAVEADETGISADLNILKSAGQLRDALVDSWERGNPDLLALSVDVRGKASRKKVDGKSVTYLEAVTGVTVDVVYEPAAGGKFLRMAAAVKAGQKEGSMLQKLLAALKKLAPKAHADIEARIKGGETVTEDEVIGLLGAIEVPAGDTGIPELDERIKAAVKEAIEGISESIKASAGVIKPPEGGEAEALRKMQLTACRMTLREELGESGLPEPVQAKLRKRFEGGVFEDGDLRSAIKEEKEVLDKLTASGAITGAGGVRVTGGELEARQQMLDDFFDGKFHSIKAAYVRITGDELVTGDLRAARNLRGGVDSTTWAEILGDSITRKMVKDYNAKGVNQDWRKICTVVPLSDFRTNRRTRMGGFGDLPTVAQSGAYTELSTPGDEEATYAAAKRGGTQEVTLEAIKNDDVGAVRKVPTRLARAAARTLYKFVLDFLKDNGAIYDALALFHADHGNLGSTALASASLTTRRQAMLQQAEADSGEVLGIPPKFLIVPPELDKTAYDLVAAPRNSDFNPTSADFTRTLQMELIVVPYWTDANNWYLSADPNDIDTIEIGFLDGREDPELFVQDMPNSGSMFSHDKLTYKIRHVYGGAVIDYRGLDGSVVA